MIELHKDMVFSACFSKDGKCLATGDRTGRVCIFDASTNTLVRDISRKATRATTYSLAFSPSADSIAIARWKMPVELVSLADGTILKSLPREKSSADQIAFATSKPLFIEVGSLRDGSIRVWDTATWNLDRTIAADTKDPAAVAFCESAMLCAVSNEAGEVFVRQIEKGDLQRKLLTAKNEAISLSFDGTGRFLAVGGDTGVLRIFDVPQGGLIKEVSLVAPISKVALSPDGSKYAAVLGPDIVVGDSASGESKRRLKHHNGPVYAIAFSPDGRRLVSGGADKAIVLWDLAK